MLYLGHTEITGLAISGGMIADAIEAALRAEAAGAALNMPKSTIALADGRLFQATLAAGAAAPAPPYAAIKVTGLAPGNHARGLPHIGSVVVLLDGASGLPAAIMDANWITAHRTAALSLVAARKLARRDATSIGFVACGVQAEAHLAAFKAEFPLERVTAYGRRRETAEHFAALARASGLDAQATDQPERAVRGQDIVITSVPAGTGLTPFLDAQWMAPGSFASLVDLGRCWREPGLESFELRATDDRKQSESGKRKLTPTGPYTGDLKELVAGTAPARRNATDRAVFVFQGLSLADLAAAALIYDAARARGAGQTLRA